MKKKRNDLIIGFDMDGVIIDNTLNKIKFAAQLGFDLKPQDTPADIIRNILPPHILEELKQLLYHDPQTSLQADLVRGAKNGLAKVKKSGRLYFLISRRKDSATAVKILKKHCLWPYYFNERNAFFVAEPEDKNLKARELGVNLYIDDEPSVLEKLVDVQQRFLMDRFNCFNDLPFHHIKVGSWKEFLSYL